MVLSIDDDDPVDQERLAEAEESLGAGEATTGEDMGNLLAERMRRADGTRGVMTSTSLARRAQP